jgi:hypothetical protein
MDRSPSPVTSSAARSVTSGGGEAVRRPHRRTGKKRGAPEGHARNYRDGFQSKAALAYRKGFAALMRECRAALREQGP